MPIFSLQVQKSAGVVTCGDRQPGHDRRRIVAWLYLIFVCLAGWLKKLAMITSVSVCRCRLRRPRVSFAGAVRVVSAAGVMSGRNSLGWLLFVMRPFLQERDEMLAAAVVF